MLANLQKTIASECFREGLPSEPQAPRRCPSLSNISSQFFPVTINVLPRGRHPIVASLTSGNLPLKRLHWNCLIRARTCTLEAWANPLPQPLGINTHTHIYIYNYIYILLANLRPKSAKEVPPKNIKSEEQTAGAIHGNMTITRYTGKSSTT